MANEEQLAILKQGAEVWNAWREENPAVNVDLGQAGLTGADLGQAALWGVDLSGASASEVNLGGANLYQADLSHADLRKADLRKAMLEGADLWKANLREAALWHANLRQADLREADLTEAHLYGADLSYSALCGADLTKADLGKAELEGANLWRAVLRDARLTEANLRKAILLEAILAGADLWQAGLRAANLGQANLRGTILWWADLSSVDLRAADLANARLLLTTLANVDLSETRGLEDAIHDGPSTIGTDTIRLSRGRVPEAFLRGCGLSDLDIEYSKLADPDLAPEQVPGITSRIQRLCTGVRHFSCFIVCEREDQEFAQLLHDDLQEAGVRCWSPPVGMRIYTPVGSGMQQQLGRQDKLVVILSENSVRSQWLGIEVKHALDVEQRCSRSVLVPIRLDRTVLNAGDDWVAEIRGRRMVDFSAWQKRENYQRAFRRLLNRLEATI